MPALQQAVGLRDQAHLETSTLQQQGQHRRLIRIWGIQERQHAQAGVVLARTESKISWADCNVPSLTSPSICANSNNRGSSFNSSTCVVVRPPSTTFSTLKCWSPYAASSGRGGPHRT